MQNRHSDWLGSGKPPKNPAEESGEKAPGRERVIHILEDGAEHQRFGVLREPMSRLMTPRVLLLAATENLAAQIRESARAAGFDMSLEMRSGREDFLDELRADRADLILATVNQDMREDSGISLHEVLEQARNSGAGLPVILLGETGDERHRMEVLRNGASDSLRFSEIDRLPSVMDRAMREHEMGSLRARIQAERDQAADMLRENQKLSTIGRLAASIAHEINNPLESVTNLLYLMGLEDHLPEHVRHYLSLAQREMERVVRISKQTLNFYRETSAPVRVRMGDLLDEVMVLYSRRIAEKNLRVIQEFDCDESVSVFPGEMRQVLSNLVTNAIEACGTNGKLYLRVRAGRKWSDSGVHGVRVSIGDNGSGISAETRRRLGEPFFTTKGQQGTGLGLWVTRAIINRYGGELQLRSTTAVHRHGTVFSAFLPTNMRPHAVQNHGDPVSGGNYLAGNAGGSSGYAKMRGSTRLRASGD